MKRFLSSVGVILFSQNKIWKWLCICVWKVNFNQGEFCFPLFFLRGILCAAVGSSTRAFTSEEEMLTHVSNTLRDAFDLMVHAGVCPELLTQCSPHLGYEANVQDKNHWNTASKCLWKILGFPHQISPGILGTLKVFCTIKVFLSCKIYSCKTKI